MKITSNFTSNFEYSFFCRVLYIDLKITSKFTSEFFKVPSEFTSNFVNFRKKKRNDIKVIF